MNNNLCKNCGSDEFISEPNRYDILIFDEGEFKIEKSESIDNEKIFCRECGREIDLIETDKQRAVIIK